MTVRPRDPVAGVFDKARRRIRAHAGLRMAASGLWPMAGVAWAAWLVHRHVHALPGRLVIAIGAAWILIGAMVIGRRLPTACQTLLRADRAVGARSLLVCAMETPTPRRAPAATLKRINRDAVAMAPQWRAALKTSLPVQWPMHGSVALLALAAAAILLTLPGAVAAPDASAAASSTAMAAATSTRQDSFARQARELTRALTTDLETPIDTSPAMDVTTSAQNTVAVTTGSAGPVVDAARTESDDATAPLPTPAATVAGPNGGRAASDAPAGRLAGIGDSDPSRTNAYRPVQRRGASGADANVDAYVHVPLGTAYDPAAAGAGSQEHAGELPGMRYLSPAMRHYLARFDRIRQETER